MPPQREFIPVGGIMMVFMVVLATYHRAMLCHRERCEKDPGNSRSHCLVKSVANGALFCCLFGFFSFSSLNTGFDKT